MAEKLNIENKLTELDSAGDEIKTQQLDDSFVNNL